MSRPLFSSTFPVRSLLFEPARRTGRACPTLVVTSGNAGDGRPSPYSGAVIEGSVRSHGGVKVDCAALECGGLPPLSRRPACWPGCLRPPPQASSRKQSGGKPPHSKAARGRPLQSYSPATLTPPWMRSAAGCGHSRRCTTIIRNILGARNCSACGLALTVAPGI